MQVCNTIFAVGGQTAQWSTSRWRNNDFWCVICLRPLSCGIVGVYYELYRYGQPPPIGQTTRSIAMSMARLWASLSVTVHSRYLASVRLDCLTCSLCSSVLCAAQRESAIDDNAKKIMWLACFGTSLASEWPLYLLCR